MPRGAQRNFDKPIEWAMVKEYPVRAPRARARLVRARTDAARALCSSAPQWQQAVLQKLAHPVDTLGNLWPLDEMGKPILAA